MPDRPLRSVGKQNREPFMNTPTMSKTRKIARGAFGTLIIPVAVGLILWGICAASGVSMFSNAQSMTIFVRGVATVMLTTIALAINLNSGNARCRRECFYNAYFVDSVRHIARRTVGHCICSSSPAADNHITRRGAALRGTRIYHNKWLERQLLRKNGRFRHYYEYLLYAVNHRRRVDDNHRAV